MKVLLASVAILLIAGTPFTNGNHNPNAKADNSPTEKVSAFKAAVAKAASVKNNSRLNKISPVTADGGI